MSTSIKHEAEQRVRALPEKANWDDLMYEIHVRQLIENGLHATDEGRVIPHDEVKCRFALDR